MDMNLSKLQETVRTEEPGVVQSKGLQRVGCDSGAEHTYTHTFHHFCCIRLVKPIGLKSDGWPAFPKIAAQKLC